MRRATGSSFARKARRATASASGATVEVQTPGLTQVREINNVASYLSANDVRLHVGLGAATVVPRIAIRWPSGTLQTLTDVPADQILTVREPPSPLDER